MNVEVKGVNDVLVMKMNQDCDFHDILNELNTLLDQPIFLQDGYFPRAYFDLGSRKLKDYEIQQLIELLKDKKRVLFDGISLPHMNNQLDIHRTTLRNGEEVHIFQETLFLGSVNPGSYVYCHDHVYFLNVVRGTIVLLNENVKVYGHDFQNAQIYMNHYHKQDLTTSALTSVYYKDEHIVISKEEGYEQDYCRDIG